MHTHTQVPVLNSGWKEFSNNSFHSELRCWALMKFRFLQTNRTYTALSFTRYNVSFFLIISLLLIDFFAPKVAHTSEMNVWPPDRAMKSHLWSVSVCAEAMQVREREREKRPSRPQTRSSSRADKQTNLVDLSALIKLIKLHCTLKTTRDARQSTRLDTCTGPCGTHPIWVYWSHLKTGHSGGGSVHCTVP